ncbi:epithelial-stromal interaction protein 1 isoform X2 [Heterodontus francisci]|uniref:epithelial-stromal interaction protein 1 isoform X2 n=1 Tax=Heterodontus francisci TaxID=7792 RepID=UPI00355B1A7B
MKQDLDNIQALADKCRGGYSVIAPNQSRRSHLQMMANRELEELRQWKEANRPGPINLTPTQLGGVTSEAEARQRQQINLRGAKFQQRAKKAEHDRKRKEAEELEIQKKKEIQREKANKLAEKRRQEDEQRKSQFQAEHHQANQQFLQRIETNRSYSHSPLPPNHTVPTTSWAKSKTYRETQREAEQQKLRELKEEQRKKSELLAEKEYQQESERQRRLQEEHRKRNKSFLDNLERRQLSNENSHCFAPPSSDEESFEHDSKQHVTASSCYEDLREDEQVYSGAMIGDSACRDSAKDTDYDWNLMKLQSWFPDYEVTALEELLLQCDGDYKSLIRLLQ